MKYNIAGITISMNPDPITYKQAEKYRVDDKEIAEFEVIPPTLEKYNSKIRRLPFDSYQYLVCGMYFHYKLFDYNGIMQHASAVVVDNKAYLFSAPCGTGKSTHTGKWLELFGESAYILNDDKPAIRVLEDGIYAYGTPWSGKHDISVNKKVPLQGICFLTRDSENWIKPMNKQTSAIRMYHASWRNLTPELLSKELEIIDEIVNRIPVYEMGCTPTIDAAQMAYDVMSIGEVK